MPSRLDLAAKLPGVQLPRPSAAPTPLLAQQPHPHPATHPLQLLVLIEEETKKKAQVVKRRYAGPMVRWKSRRIGECEAVSCRPRA